MEKLIPIDYADPERPTVSGRDREDGKHHIAALGLRKPKLTLPCLSFTLGFEAPLALLAVRSGEITVSELAIPRSGLFIFVAWHN